jgi:hypothetical protein
MNPPAISPNAGKLSIADSAWTDAADRPPAHQQNAAPPETGEMTEEQFDFLMAIDQYKKANQRPFPTWTEVLEVIHALGYRKVAEPQALKSFKKEQEPVPVG